MLKTIVSQLEDVDESLHLHYVPNTVGRGFVLDLEGTPNGFAPKADLAESVNKVTEFRNNNIALTKELEELRPLKTQFDGIDANAARFALAQVQELEKKGVKKPDDVAAQITAALNDFTTKVVDPLKAQLQTSETARQQAEKEAETSLLRTRVGEEFIGMGGKPGAMDFILSKAQNVFSIVNNEVIANENQFSTNKPGEPITPVEWLAQQSISTDADFAFNASNGGGASPKAGEGKAGAKRLVNPSPAELGANMDAIASGKIVVEHSGQ